LLRSPCATQLLRAEMSRQVQGEVDHDSERFARDAPRAQSSKPRIHVILESRRVSIKALRHQQHNIGARGRPPKNILKIDIRYEAPIPFRRHRRPPLNVERL